MPKKIDFEGRYVQKLPKNAPPDMKTWATIRGHAMQSTKNRCSMNLLHEAAEVHHVRYSVKNWRRVSKPIAGRERVGKDVFPLCQACHGIAHRKVNWREHEKDPVLESRNTRAYQVKIRNAWLISQLLVKIPGVVQFARAWQVAGVFTLVPIVVLVIAIGSQIIGVAQQYSPVPSRHDTDEVFEYFDGFMDAAE